VLRRTGEGARTYVSQHGPYLREPAWLHAGLIKD